MAGGEDARGGVRGPVAVDRGESRGLSAETTEGVFGEVGGGEESKGAVAALLSGIDSRERVVQCENLDDLEWDLT